MESLSSATNTVTVKVLVSFFLSESGRSISSQAIQKEKCNVPIDDSHNDLYNFAKRVVAFTYRKQISSSKGLGQNPEVTFALVKKNQIGGVDVFFPDSVHVGKSLKCSICNWFIILNGERGCLSIMQTLRDDSNPAVRKKLRKLLKAEDMQSKDRMAVEPIIRLSNPEVPDILKEVNKVVHQLIPEKYSVSENNQAGMFPHSIAITCSQQGKFFFLDLHPLKSAMRLVEAHLHNPVRLKLVKTEIPVAPSLCYLNGFGAVVICCREAKVLQVVDIEKRIKMKLSSIPSYNLQNWKDAQSHVMAQ